MTKLVLIVCIIAICIPMFAISTAAADIPTPYFDMEFTADGKVYDAMGNTTATACCWPF